METTGIVGIKQGSRRDYRNILLRYEECRLCSEVSETQRYSCRCLVAEQSFRGSCHPELHRVEAVALNRICGLVFCAVISVFCL